MYKSMRELGKIQTEAQLRHELHPLTQEEIDNPELFNQTPQNLSAICDFKEVTAAARQTPLKKKTFQNKADSERAAMAFLEQITAPPPLRSKHVNDLVTELQSEAA